MGGVGLYMSLRNYLTILRHLLQIVEGKATNPILKLETAKKLFEPALPEKGVQSINALMVGSGAPPGMSWTKGAMAVTTQDWKGRKKAGSAQCKLLFHLCCVSKATLSMYIYHRGRMAGNALLD